MNSYFYLMALNNAYANEKLLGAVCELSDEEFSAPRSGFFPSLKATLNHVLFVDRYYLDALYEEGVGKKVYDAEEISNPGELKSKQAKEDARLVAFCRDLTDKATLRQVATDRGDKGAIEERVDALLLHLFQHQVHHRGQAHAMLSSTRVKPPQLDEFFLEFERDPVAEKHLKTAGMTGWQPK
ncbi:DinB family protein [Rhizobiales bacterium]|uniref:DinB family protein n=1 Tax=Hongsoonwoonella zoysiae TaxID=2821844 RepID=UPI00155FDFD0|nr:DinB family protein [Hongsoonwoonella zoysiae]NRG16729.1 DinB family protein [Hongsoonwoonella zoysiae]